MYLQRCPFSGQPVDQDDDVWGFWREICNLKILVIPLPAPFSVYHWRSTFFSWWPKTIQFEMPSFRVELSWVERGLWSHPRNNLFVYMFQNYACSLYWFLLAMPTCLPACLAVWHFFPCSISVGWTDGLANSCPLTWRVHAMDCFVSRYLWVKKEILSFVLLFFPSSSSSSSLPCSHLYQNKRSLHDWEELLTFR